MKSPSRWIRNLFRQPKFRNYRRPTTRLQFEILEDRSVPSTYIPLLPTTGTAQTMGNNETPNPAVVYTPESDDSLHKDLRPGFKFVTLMNNSSSVVYPIFFNSNSSADKANDPTKSKYDPKDTLNNTYRGYVGEIVNGQYQLGLQPGHQMTVMVPLVFWDGGRVYMVSNGPVPLSSPQDPGNPLQANNVWTYNPSATPDTLQDLGPGLSYVVAPTKEKPTPLYGANWADPDTGYSNPDGVVMWYHETTVQGKKDTPHEFGFGIPAVLTEFTFRDKNQKFIAPNMPADQQFNINDYDVSYVDSLGMPASMEATDVPSLPPTPGSTQLAWTGSDLSITQMQEAIKAYTTNNIDVATTPLGVNGLGEYFGGLGWDQFFLPKDINSTANGTIVNIIHNNPNAGITIVTNAGGAAELVNGGAVTISGVIDKVTNQPDTIINKTWTIGGVDPVNNSFILANLKSDPSKQYDFSAATWKVSPTTGIHLEKLPSGQNVINLSQNLNSASQFNASQYNLVSGGVKANVGTAKPGFPPTAVATAGSHIITGVSTDQALQMVAGMLWNTADNAAGVQIFQTGAAIASIQIGTPGGNDSKIIMSVPAKGSGSPGNAGPGGVFQFSGSQYKANAATYGSQAEIAANSNVITGLDPNVGMYLRVGMLVSGPGIAPNGTPPAGFSGVWGATQTFITQISPDFKTITLSQGIGSTASTGPYTFLGAPVSPIVQTLINNWYAWADYYVNQLAAGGANAAPSGTFTATATGNTNIEKNYGTIVLTNVPASFDMNKLRVGDVVTSQGATLVPNPTLAPGKVYDPSLNYTIVNFDQIARTVELSLPVNTAITTPTVDTFTFAPPQFVVRSGDAPAATGASITNIDNTNGVTITTTTTSRLVDNQQVVISGVTGQTSILDNGTPITTNINGTWAVKILSSTQFQLVGSTGNGGAASTGPASKYTATAGTIPYTLSFTVTSNAFNPGGIDNTNGQPITITTSAPHGLSTGEQITISGVNDTTSGTSAAINGLWTVKVIDATHFQLAGLTSKGDPAKGGILGDGHALSGGTWAHEESLQFAQTVYDTMQSFSLLIDPTKYSSRSTQQLSYIIGGNTGTFVQNDDPNGPVFPITGRHTMLPDRRTSLELRDQIKSLLRGVYDFTVVSDQSDWYPDPAAKTPNATLNGAPINFGAYNLDPYVYFIHKVLYNSSYGFSFDDDVANVNVKDSRHIQIAVGGNADTSPDALPDNVLSNPEAFTQGAMWGTQTQPPGVPQAYIDVTSSHAKDPVNAGKTTITGLDESVVARLTASNPAAGDTPGAYITSSTNGLLPAGVTVEKAQPLATKTGSISAIDNTNGQPIKITTTVDFGDLAIGDVVTIKGVVGRAAINDSWVVKNVVKPNSGPYSFELDYSINTGQTITGDGSAITTPGDWLWLPSFITFATPKAWTPPTKNSPATFTFSGFLGTTVPDGITPSVSNAPAGSTITINGKGFTGAYGVSFNGYPGKIVGTPTDTSIQVVVPDFTPNSNGTTYPGPTGKIAVRNQSGTNYSDSFFTIGAATGPTVTATTTNRAQNAPTVVINGTGFSATPGNNTVAFDNGAAGTVTAATTTQLTVTFTPPPAALGSLRATVTTNGQSSGALTQVATVVAPPTVTPNTANLPQNATTIVINGTGFDTTASGNTVVFDRGAAGTVTAATATQLTVLLTTKPTSLGALTAVVTSFGGPSGTPQQVATVVAAGVTVTPNTASQSQSAPTIIINGSGFSTIEANNSVTFDLGAAGTVTSASDTQLVVTFTTLPTSLGALKAVVTANGVSSGAPTQVATIVASGQITASIQVPLPIRVKTPVTFGGTYTNAGANPKFSWTVTNSNNQVIATGNTQNLTVTFPHHGNYTVSFTVTDAQNVSANDTRVVNASNVDAPLRNDTDYYVGMLYVQLLGRQGSAQEIYSWSDLSQRGYTRADIADLIMDSDEWRGRMIDSYYRSLFGRPADSAGLNTFLKAMAAGKTLENVKSELYGSPEYIQKRTDATFNSWVNAIYRDELGRDVDSAGLAAFQSLRNRGFSYTQMAYELIISPEARQVLVKSWYLTYLGRPADTAGLNNVVAALQSGKPQDKVLAGIVGSDEYFRNL